jgi:hypothetical protein
LNAFEKTGITTILLLTLSFCQARSNGFCNDKSARFPNVIGFSVTKSGTMQIADPSTRADSKDFAQDLADLDRKNGPSDLKGYEGAVVLDGRVIAARDHDRYGQARWTVKAERLFVGDNQVDSRRLITVTSPYGIGAITLKCGNRYRLALMNLKSIGFKNGNDCFYVWKLLNLGTRY